MPTPVRSITSPRPVSRFSLALAAALLLSACQGLGANPVTSTAPALPPAPAGLEPVARLDLMAYMGRWHEVASYPNFFQRNCAADTRAVYSLLPSGMVQVDNQCRNFDGKVIGALGVARRVGPEGSARLEVRFAPDWLAWIPLVWGDYWVLDLEADGRLVAVGEPSRNYFWILSRDAIPDEARVQAMLARLKARGIDTARLKRTPQTQAIP